MKITFRSYVFLATFFSALIHSAIALTLRVTTDEAYYASWVQNFSFGYLDHPPMVAWLASGYPFLGTSSVFFLRALGLVFTSLQVPLICKIAKRLYPDLSNKVVVWAAFFLVQINLYGLVSGLLLTPDLGMIFFWTLALHEVIAAVGGSPRRWLSAGLALGFALLSKYISILFLLGLFIALLTTKGRRHLKSPYPWLGFILTILVFSPHLLWNAGNEFITFKFQWSHGIYDKHAGESALKKLDQPIVLADVKDSYEEEMARYFLTPDEKQSLQKPKKQKSSIEQFLFRMENFFGAVLGVWGLYLFAILYLVFINRKKIKKRTPRSIEEYICLSLALSPLLFFGVIALFTKVEGNWPAVYTVSAGLIFIPLFKRNLKVLVFLGSLHIALITFLALSSRFPQLAPTAFANNRVFKETQGYQELASFLKKNYSDKKIYAETYQTTAMLDFYEPKLDIDHLRGISRTSEFQRQRKENWLKNDDDSLSIKVLNLDNFVLILDRDKPARIANYELAEFSRLRICYPNNFVVEKRDNSSPYIPACRVASRINSWSLAYYQKVHPSK